MAVKPRPTIVIGRAQAARPPAEDVTSAHAQQSERALAGALMVPIEQLIPDPHQPRKHVEPQALEELAASLRAYGVLQPLVVREAATLADGRNRYMLIAGERRYLAAQQAGLTYLPVLVREGEGVRLRVLQLIENVQREGLAPVDEARAYREIMELEHLSIRDVAGLIKRSHGYVAERLDLVKSEDVASAVQAGRVPASAAAVVAREKNPELRRALLERVEREKLQRRDVERIRREAHPVRPSQRTLREVAVEMGATEDQVRAAATARRADHALTIPEALMLAMQEPSGTQPRPTMADLPDTITQTGVALTSTVEVVPALPPMDRAAVDLILLVLTWARHEGLSHLDALRARLETYRDQLS